MIGEGYTEMTAEDIADAKTVDLVVNMNEATRDPPGIGYIKFSGRVFVVSKHGVTGQIVVLGIRDPKYLLALRSFWRSLSLDSITFFPCIFLRLLFS